MDTRSRDSVQQAPEVPVSAGGVSSSRWSARTRVIVAGVFLFVFIWLGRKYFGELDRLSDADPRFVAALIAVLLVGRLFNSEAMWIALDALGRRVGRFELYLLTFVRTYSSLVVPRAGLGATGVYLKMKHGVSYADSASLLLPMVVMQMLVIGAMGLATQLAFSRMPEVPASPVLIGVFSTVMACGCAGILLRLPTSGGKSGRLFSFAYRLNQSWRLLSKNRSVVWRVLLVQVGQISVRALQLYVAFRALGVPVSPVGVLAASLLADVMFIISLTPNALGFREAAIVYSSRITGVNEATSLAVAVLDRLVVTLVVIIVAQFVLFYVVRPKRQIGAD